jgi:hypothetical protein
MFILKKIKPVPIIGTDVWRSYNYINKEQYPRKITNQTFRSCCGGLRQEKKKKMCFKTNFGKKMNAGSPDIFKSSGIRQFQITDGIWGVL